MDPIVFEKRERVYLFLYVDKNELQKDKYPVAISAQVDCYDCCPSVDGGNCRLRGGADHNSNNIGCDTDIDSWSLSAARLLGSARCSGTSRGTQSHSSGTCCDPSGTASGLSTRLVCAPGSAAESCCAAAVACSATFTASATTAGQSSRTVAQRCCRGAPTTNSTNRYHLWHSGAAVGIEEAWARAGRM